MIVTNTRTASNAVAESRQRGGVLSTRILT
jgi:hypothetical protein